MIQVNSEDKFGLLELICAGVLFGLGVMHVITFCVVNCELFRQRRVIIARLSKTIQSLNDLFISIGT